MSGPAFIRINLGDEYDLTKLARKFRRVLQKNGLIKEEFLYHAFDGRESIDLVHAIGCDVRDPQAYSCGTAEGLKPGSKLYNPLDTATRLEKPGILIYKKRSLICLDKEASLYRFRGHNYFRSLVAIVVAKRIHAHQRHIVHPIF